MCFYAYKNVLEPMGHLGANLIFSILTLNQVIGGCLGLSISPTNRPPAVPILIALAAKICAVPRGLACEEEQFLK